MFDYRKEIMGDKVPNLELCKKLKELGYPQRGNSGFEWVKLANEDDWKLIWFDGNLDSPFVEQALDWITAPTSEEMIEYLPKTVDNYQLNILYESGTWLVGYFNQEWEGDVLVEAYAEKLADALATLIIKLKENNYI